MIGDERTPIGKKWRKAKQEPYSSSRTPNGISESKPFSKHKYNVAVTVILGITGILPINRVCTTGVKLRLAKEAMLSCEWSLTFRSDKRTHPCNSLKRRMKIISTIMLHVKLGEPRGWIVLRVFRQIAMVKISKIILIIIWYEGGSLQIESSYSRNLILICFWWALGNLQKQEGNKKKHFHHGRDRLSYMWRNRKASQRRLWMRNSP